MIEHKQRNFGLDIVRSFAISMVILSHFANTNCEIFGFWGVELFFALSGYLIGNILWRNFSTSITWSYLNVKNFWFRRWWRTIPNYYLFLAVSVIYFHYNKYPIPPLQELSKFLYFGQFAFSKTSDFYGMSWSLCVEEWFYFTFPILLLFVNTLKFKKQTSFTIVILIFYFATILIKILLLTKESGLATRQITFTRLDAIVSGVLVTYVESILKFRKKDKLILFFIGLILVLSPFINYLANRKGINLMIQNPEYLMIVPLGFAFCLPLLSCWQTSFNVPKIISYFIENVSQYAYSLYLCHLYILFSVYYIMSTLRGTTFYGNFLSKFISLILSLLTASLIFKYFEVPLTKYRPEELKTVFHNKDGITKDEILVRIS